MLVFDSTPVAILISVSPPCCSFRTVKGNKERPKLPLLPVKGKHSTVISTEELSREMEKTLLILLVLLVLSASCNGECIENLPELRDQGKMSPAFSLNEAQVVIPAYRISCLGVIVQWGMYTEKRGGHLIELQVWREAESNTYRKVGGNWFNQAPTKGEKLLYFTPDPSVLISVEPGDFIGLYILHNPGINDNYKIQYESSSDVQMLYMPASSPQPDNIDPALTDSWDIALLLHVEVSPHQSTSSSVPIRVTSSPPPTDKPNSRIQQDQQLINAAIGSTAGFVLVMIVAVVVVAVLLLLYLRKRKRSLQITTNDSRASGLPKPNYTGDLKRDPVYVAITENPAYGQHTDSLAHEYEIPSVNKGHALHQVKPQGHPPQPEYYETMAAFEESSEYTVMESSAQVVKCSVDGPIYEEPT